MATEDLLQTLLMLPVAEGWAVVSADQGLAITCRHRGQCQQWLAVIADGPQMPPAVSVAGRGGGGGEVASGNRPLAPLAVLVVPFHRGCAATLRGCTFTRAHPLRIASVHIAHNGL